MPGPYQLYLIRHGIAEERGPDWPDDGKRPLTSEGISRMKRAANGLVRCLKAEGVPWVACYPTNHVNNALGQEGVPIKMMGEERFAVAIADAVSRVTSGKQIGVCTIMSNLNAAGIQMAFGAIGQAW